MGTEWVVIAPLVGVALFFVIAWAVRAPGRALQARIVRLGDLRGWTRDDLTEYVGPPQAVSAQPGGKVLLQWMAAGYHIALLFDKDGVCEGVSHEAAV
jgi:hypothetical protein